MNLIDLLKENGLIEYEGLSFTKIEDYQKKLFKAGMANIPFEYAAFLNRVNGIQTDTLSLFGIKTDSSFIRDIYAENSMGNAIQNDEIFLGDNSEEYLFYRWPAKSFIVMNKKDHNKISSFVFLEPALRHFLRLFLIPQKTADQIEKIRTTLGTN